MTTPFPKPAAADLREPEGPVRWLREALERGEVEAVRLDDGAAAAAELRPEQVLAHLERERWAFVLRDDPARKAAEAELRYEKALLESQNEASFDGILIVDAESRIVSVNQRFLDLWGVPGELMRRGGNDEEALNSVLAKLEDPEEFLRTIEHLFDHPQEKTKDEVRFKDGRILERWSTPVHGKDGTYYGRGWYFRDVTERRHQEEALKDANAQLEEHERQRTQLINTLCHDLGTPLTPVKVQLHLLKASLEAPTEKQERAFSMMSRNLAQLEALLADMRDVGRLQANVLRLAPEAFDLSSLAAEVAEAFEGPAKERGLAITFEAPRPLPVYADPKRVRQVLFNLVSNALKFTPPGGRIAVRAQPHAAGAEVRVEDNGRGLTAEQMALLFRPFSQVHDPLSQSDRGTGLGLYISRGLVERMGGRLDVASEGTGHGSTFAFTLPAEPLEHPACLPKPATP